MKTLGLAIGLLFTLTSCIEVKGRLEVNTPLEVKSTKKTVSSGRLGNHRRGRTRGTARGRTVEEMKTILPGNYSATLKFPSKKKVSLLVKGAADSKKVNVEFEIPSGTNLPERNGSFRLSAAQVGQPHDIGGNVETRFSRSDVKYDRESCTYTTYERVCKPVCKQKCRTKPDGTEVCREKCQRKCEREEVTKWGKQDVEYHYEYEDRDYLVTLFAPGTNMETASFNGTWHDSDKVYDYKGYCEGPRGRHHRHHNHFDWD